MLNFFNVIKNKTPAKYIITKKEIEKVAKRSFTNIISFLKNVNNLSSIDKSDLKISSKQIFDKMRIDFGVDTTLGQYDKNQLENDNFRIFCIYNVCLEMLIGKKISTAEYIIYKNVLETIANENVNNSSIDSFILNTFKVDPSILPLSYKQRIMAIDEFTIATEMIVTALQSTSFPNGYNTYQEYYDYMLTEAKSIINKLHDKGFYNTQEMDRFTLLCTAYKIGIPSMDTFYKRLTSSKEITPSMPTEHLRNIQEQIFDIHFNR